MRGDRASTFPIHALDGDDGVFRGRLVVDRDLDLVGFAQPYLLNHLLGFFKEICPSFTGHTTFDRLVTTQRVLSSRVLAR
jgi:hypothetical protein